MRRTPSIASAVAVLMLMIGSSTAQRFANADEAEAAFKRLVTKRMSSRAEMAQRNEAVRDWLRDAETVELGARSFTRPLARYFLHEYDAAVAGLIDYLKANGSFPDAGYHTMVGRVFMNGIVRGARKGDLSRTEELMKLALEYYPRARRQSVYRLAGMQLARAEKVDTAMLIRVTTALLADDDLSDQDKIDALKAIFAPPRAARPRESAPKPLAAFEAVGMAGNRVSLADYRGKVVLVDFWATWCGPCIGEMPNVVAAYRRHGPSGFEVIGVSLDKENEAEKIRATCKRLGMTWPQIYEGKGWQCSLAKKNNVRSIPATWLIDRQGKVRYTNLRGPALERRVRELLSEKAPAPRRK